jgi:antitoxin ParD1/3/4
VLTAILVLRGPSKIAEAIVAFSSNARSGASKGKTSRQDWCLFFPLNSYFALYYGESPTAIILSIIDNCCYQSYCFSMNVNLGSVFDQFVADLLKTGLYQSQSEILRDGLRLLKEREDLKKLRLVELRKEIAIGSEQADRGEFVDGKEAFAEIRKRSAGRKRAKG